ncbi:MAG: DUF805 domain-containing protein [Thiotrichaceae bacterium]|nr:DUF805 domain-containing protein [Thiotrichaceae bacterium]
MTDNNPYTAPKSNLSSQNRSKRDNSSPFQSKGRFSRYSFLAWNFIVNMILLLVVTAVITIFVSLKMIRKDFQMNDDLILGLFTMLALLVFFIFNIIFLIRRLHDIDLQGWWALLIFIPIVNIVFGLFVLIKKGTEESNRFAPIRTTPRWEKVVGIISLVLLVLYCALILIGTV